MSNDYFRRRLPSNDSGDGQNESSEGFQPHSSWREAASGGEVERLPWSAREVVVRRTETEIVRAYWWWRGEELVIKLQWLVRGQDDQWYPMNTLSAPLE